MTTDTATAAPGRSGDDRPMGLFQRWLSLWVALAIVAGVSAGNLWPGPFALLAGLEVAHVNLVVAVLIWAMVYPMMITVDFTSLAHVGDRPRGLAVTLVVNWLIKPFTMAALGILCFQWLFASLVTPEDAAGYIAGMILLGAAPCTAMVFVWSRLTCGDPTYTLVQVALNDLILVFAFAPLVALLLGVADVHVPWDTLLLSVVLYVVVPLIAGTLTRRTLMRRGGAPALAAFTVRIEPVTIGGLILTVLLLFAFQGERLLSQPLAIVLIAVPLILQTALIFALAWLWARSWRVPFAIGAPAALIGTSNFFELAVAVAISLFGLGSAAALATVVGVLVEVPVMLLLCRIVNAGRPWYERGLVPDTAGGQEG